MRKWSKAKPGPNASWAPVCYLTEDYCIQDESLFSGRTPDWETYVRHVHDEWVAWTEIRDRRRNNTKEQAQRLAQAFLFCFEHPGVARMIKSLCPVCGSQIVNRKQDMLTDSVVMESSESCVEDSCRLYEAEYLYGVLRERIGLVVIERSWAHVPEEYRKVEEARRVLIEEAKTIRLSDTAMALSRAMAEDPVERTPAYGAADWCEENDCPMTGETLHAWAAFKIERPQVVVPLGEDPVVDQQPTGPNGTDAESVQV